MQLLISPPATYLRKVSKKKANGPTDGSGPSCYAPQKNRCRASNQFNECCAPTLDKNEEIISIAGHWLLSDKQIALWDNDNAVKGNTCLQAFLTRLVRAEMAKVFKLYQISVLLGLSFFNDLIAPSSCTP
jgi:hypothetical protein